MMNKLQPCLTEWWWEEYYEVHGLLTSRAALKNLWEATHREDTWSRLASQCSRMSYCWGSKIHFCTSTSSSTSKRAQTFSFFIKKVHETRIASSICAIRWTRQPPSTRVGRMIRGYVDTPSCWNKGDGLDGGVLLRICCRILFSPGATHGQIY
jgi:hypothetical protein